jgi:hypothetical protein
MLRNGPIGASEVAWSCVVDDTPEIRSSIVPWLATAIELAHIEPAQIHVHHVCALDPEIAQLCLTLEVNTHRIEPFDSNYPHTNKIRQCATAFAGVRAVILTDVDVVFAGPPPLGEIQDPVAGKPVDLPKPPIEILRRVFAAAGLPHPHICTNAYVHPDAGRVEFETFPGNYNGGVYVIDREHWAPIGEAWAYWARWLIRHIHLLGRWAKHVDQVSFCLAANQLRMAMGLLEDTWNFPLHLKMAPGGKEPFVLHHHALLDDHCRLRPVSAPRVTSAIARVNGAIEDFQRLHFAGHRRPVRTIVYDRDTAGMLP